MTKAQITPPARAKLNGLWVFPGDDRLMSAWAVLDEVGGEFRRKGRMGFEIQRDLMLYASLIRAPVYVGAQRGRTPYPIFPRAMIEEWLEAGGRSWILAELEAIASKRVIPFPGQRTRR